jgi:hypothetical protein
VWAGVDSAWEQEKLVARKMIDAKRAADSPSSAARFVGRFFTEGSMAKKETYA